MKVSYAQHVCLFSVLESTVEKTEQMTNNQPTRWRVVELSTCGACRIVALCANALTRYQLLIQHLGENPGFSTGQASHALLAHPG